MKQTLLLMMLALGICSTTSFSQVKSYQVEDDGFEWYKIEKEFNGTTLYGAEDRYGNMLIPTEYSIINYWCYNDNPVRSGFHTAKGEYYAWYNKGGKCVVPCSRRYTQVVKEDDNDEFGTYYSFEKENGGGILDRNGREVVLINTHGPSIVKIECDKIDGKKYYYLYFRFKKDGEMWSGFADANGEIIIEPYRGDLFKPSLIRDYIKTRKNTLTTNPLVNNRHETLAEAQGGTSASSSTASSNSSSSNNSGNNTTTVVVEHHRDPVPVQEWQQCPACYGSGQCPNVQCGGSGWYYIGDKARTCSRCHGSGKCTICAGKGGHYVTVYR